MTKLNNFLVIGAYSRNAGKTTFTEKVIKTMKGNLIALKITIIKSGRLKCPRGGSGCGVCTTLETEFEITEEINSTGSKDTSKLLKAGASKVYWLRVKDKAVHKGMEALLKRIDKTKPVVCESNSIMKFINPALFILLQSDTVHEKKESATIVESKANEIIKTSAESSNFDFQRLQFNEQKWTLKG